MTSWQRPDERVRLKNLVAPAITQMAIYCVHPHGFGTTMVDRLADFTPHERSSAFLDLIGPVLSRTTASGIEFALRMDERHVNARGFAHGGVLAALADVALGYATSSSQEPPARLITASLTISFAGAVGIGETVVARVDVQRVGRRIAFANCYLTSGDRRVVHASAVFANEA